MEIRSIFNLKKALMCTRHKFKKSAPKNNPYYQFKDQDELQPQKKTRTNRQILFELRRTLTKFKATTIPFFKSLMCFAFISRFSFVTLLMYYLYSRYYNDSTFIKVVKIERGEEQRYSRTIGMEKDFDQILIQNRNKQPKAEQQKD